MNRISALTIAAVLLTFSTAPAQMEPPPPQRGLERVERWKKVRMVEALDLSEDQASRLFARLNDFEKQRRELMRERGELLDRVERLLSAGADSIEFEKTFAEVRAVDRKMVDSRIALVGGLEDLLTLKQRARFLLFERRFDIELRDAMREVQRRRRMPHEQ